MDTLLVPQMPRDGCYYLSSGGNRRPSHCRFKKQKNSSHLTHSIIWNQNTASHSIVFCNFIPYTKNLSAIVKAKHTY